MDEPEVSLGVDVSSLQPWRAIWNAIYLVSPLFAFAIGLSLLIYFMFVTVPEIYLSPTRKDDKAPREQLPDVPAGQAPAPAPANSSASEKTQLVFILMACTSGVILGMFVKLLGGLDAIFKGGEGTVTGTVSSIVIIALSTIGSLLTDAKVGSMNKPLGSLGLLLCLLTSAFYWKLM